MFNNIFNNLDNFPIKTMCQKLIIFPYCAWKVKILENRNFWSKIEILVENVIIYIS